MKSRSRILGSRMRWIALAALAGCSSRQDSGTTTRQFEVLTPEVTPVAWLGADSGIVYGRVDIIGTGLGDVFEVSCDSAGLYLTGDRARGRPWRSGSAICDALRAARSAAYSVSLSPKHDALVYADGNNAGAIFRLDLETLQPVLLRRECLPNVGRPAWSPDGHQIALAANCAAEGNRSFLHTANRDGSGMTPVGTPRDSLPESEPSWSPDGGHIALTRGSRLWADSVVVVELRTGKRRTLTSGFEPSWSPINDRIAYFRMDSSRTAIPSIRTIRADGTEDRELFVVPTQSGSTSGNTPPWPGGPLIWSPDAKSVAFSRGASIWTIEVDSRRVDSVFNLKPWQRSKATP